MNEWFRWGWALDHVDEIAAQTSEHVVLTLIAVAIGAFVSLPLGIYAARHRWFYGPVASATGILYTIPSLALFAFLTPITGLSTTTAEIGLVSYTLLILIRNVVGGLDAVSPDVKEAARAMGYSGRQILTRVELPLALPVIVAGVRIAAVTTIGLVTVTALIGKGGLGYFILLGLQLSFPTAILIGAVLSAALAIATDRLLVLVERALTPWSAGRVGGRGA